MGVKKWGRVVRIRNIIAATASGTAILRKRGNTVLLHARESMPRHFALDCRSLSVIIPPTYVRGHNRMLAIHAVFINAGASRWQHRVGQRGPGSGVGAPARGT